ncbi:MAG: hypothetical protein ABF441_13715 [Lentilactobacillus hilgardii]|uniref:hypothetical protein n=1 Tax=Lentilactobacillus hilgardii TaxID=1588 RepID=UPI0039EBAA1E
MAEIDAYTAKMDKNYNCKNGMLAGCYAVLKNVVVQHLKRQICNYINPVKNVV